MEPLIFKLNPESYPALRKKVITKTILLMVIVWVVVSCVMLKDANRDDLILIICTTGCLVLYYIYVLVKSLKKRKKLYYSYTLTVDELNITRRQEGLSDMQIPIEEITTIEKTTDNRFIIRGTGKALLERILVPHQITDYDELEEVLASFKTITISTKPNYLEKYGLPIVLVFIAPILCVFLVDNKIVVGISAAISTTMIVYSIFYMAKYKNTVNSWKRALWIYPLVLIFLLVVAYFKLIA
jgi:hypothetical protein